jgi:hypothetical protein
MNNKIQANLYKYRNEIKQLIVPIDIGKERYKYLYNFFKKNISLFTVTLTFLISQTIFEITLLLLANDSLKNLFSKVETLNNKVTAIVILFCCISYTVLAFLAIKYERTLVLKLINALRRILYNQNLQEKTFKNTYETRSNFIAKISYHLSLLTMGIDNTLISAVRWILYMIVIIIFSIVNKGSYLYITGLIFILSIILFSISYLISKKYISRQIASYSKIIRHISNTMFEIPFIKNFHREKINEKKLDNVVEIDTYFRISRDTLLRYSNRVVFILVISFGAIYLLLSTYYPYLILEFSGQALIKGIFYLYIIRILYSSIKAGLFLLPLKIGVFLSVPDNFTTMANPRKKWEWEKIIFKSNKIKLFKESLYFKNVSIEFNRGGKYLFIGDYQSGKTHLASLFAGQGFFSNHSWIVNVDKEHFSYNYWCEIFKDNYFFLPHFSTDATVGEIILSKEKEDITENDINTIDNLSVKYPIFYSIFSQTRFIGESARRFESSYVSIFAIQTVYCLINKPKFIVIDNIWIDLSYNEILEFIQILEKELPLSIIILFSRKNNSILKYSNIYEIKERTIKKI